jgi:hypothetical protein
MYGVRMLVRMGDTPINVPVKVRTHELNQVHEMIPQVEEQLRSIGVEATVEQADELERIYAEHIEGIGVEPRESEEFAAYLSMPADDWRSVVSALARVDDGLRPRWLQKKLVKRLRARLDEMEDE